MTTRIDLREAMVERMQTILQMEAGRFGVDARRAFVCTAVARAGHKGGIRDVTLGLRRGPTISEHPESQDHLDTYLEMGFDDDLEPRADLVLHLEKAARRYARAIRREKDLKAPADQAPWSMTMHVATDAFLRHHGIDSHAIMQQFAPSWTWVRQAIKQTKGLHEAHFAIDAGRMLPGSLSAIVGERRLVIRSETARPTRTTIEITDTKLPESMMTCLPGMRLREVVDHEAFQDLDVRIERAFCDEDDGEAPNLRLLLEYDHVVMGDPPGGGKFRWLDGDLKNA